MHFPIEFLLLGLVGKGTKWIGGKGWLPPKESGMPFKSRGKVGYLGADGKPAIDENDKPLTAKQKAEIMKKEEQMKAAEMGTRSSSPIKRKPKEEPTARKERLWLEAQNRVSRQIDKTYQMGQKMDEIRQQIRDGYKKVPTRRKYKEGLEMKSVTKGMEADDRKMERMKRGEDDYIRRQKLNKNQIAKLNDQLDKVTEDHDASLSRVKALQRRADRMFSSLPDSVQERIIFERQQKENSRRKPPGSTFLG